MFSTGLLCPVVRSDKTAATSRHLIQTWTDVDRALLECPEQGAVPQIRGIARMGHPELEGGDGNLDSRPAQGTDPSESRAVNCDRDSLGVEYPHGEDVESTNLRTGKAGNAPDALREPQPDK